MSGLQVCLLLPGADDNAWYGANLRSGFAALGNLLVRAGFRLIVPRMRGEADAEEADDWHPQILRPIIEPAGVAVVAGPGPGSMTEVLRRGYCMAQYLKREPPDIVLAPLSRGMAQPLLMARATGEGFAETAVCIWADAPAHVRLRSDDAAVTDPSPLVDDAMERAVLRYADTIIGGSGRRLEMALQTARAGGKSGIARLPAPGWAVRGGDRGGIAPTREFALCGCGSRGHGLPAFLDAAEELARCGQMNGRCVSFLGPLRTDAPGLSKTLLGVRAQSWPFAFTVPAVTTPLQVWRYLLRPGVLPVFAGTMVDDDVLIAALVAADIPFVIASGHPLAQTLKCGGHLWDMQSEPLAQALQRAAVAPGVPQFAAAAGDWPGLLLQAHRQRGARNRQERPTASIAVCVTHRERPDCLRRALASVAKDRDAAAEIVVVDDGSTSVRVQAVLNGLQSGSGFQLIRLAQPVGQAAAYNMAARAAAAEVLVFLDDDNVVAPRGLSRFAHAFRDSAIDIVVTCLDLCDDAGCALPSARLVFMGEAGSAGLFFNGFGDTALAIRRRAFLDLGGFDADSASAPALDWVFLAKAQAAGLRIAVLQEPAIRYARDLQAADRKWRKRDQEGARSAVLRAYAGRFDAELVARLAQGSTLHTFID
ncbi:MAG: glycosyltransferase [Nevskia sp.]|nr:glycosyltransferase [Nevskia sp.]